MAKAISQTFKALAVTAFALALSACGRGAMSGDLSSSQELKRRLFREPNQKLSTSLPEKYQSFDVYNVIDVQVAADKLVSSISARAIVSSAAGRETIELVGVIRPDGSGASLVDVSPLADGKNRLVAEATCFDKTICKHIIVNVYYNVAGIAKKKQFVSTELLANDESSSENKSNESAHEHEDDAHVSEKDLQDETSEADSTLGEFVGSPRNEALIGKLYQRSAVPEVPADPEAPKTATPEAAAPKTPTAAQTPQPVAAPKSKQITTTQAKPVSVQAKPAQTGAKLKTPAKPTATKPLPAAKRPARKIQRKVLPTPNPTPPQPSQAAGPGYMQQAKDWLKSWFVTAPVVTPVVKAPKPSPVVKQAQRSAPMPKPSPSPKPKPAPKLTPVSTPKPVPIAVSPPVIIAPKLPDPIPVPALEIEPLPSLTAQPPGTMDVPFPPATPSPEDNDNQRRISSGEMKTAALLNLRDGGIATGSYSGSGPVRATLKNASVLPQDGHGLSPIRINANAHYGTGMLVSFLQNSAAYLFRQLGLTLFVGDMSLKNGGKIGRSHQTHRNGLDADIAYLAIRRPLQDSALDQKGAIANDFNFEATWSFLELAAQQEFVSEAKRVSSISRVFMSHRVKDAFCAWAKEEKKLKDPAASELMRLIRREKGHHKHFHLSLKCSPYYPTCRNLAGPPPEGTGCS